MTDSTDTVAELNKLVLSAGDATSLPAFFDDLSLYAARLLRSDSVQIVLEDVVVRRFARGGETVKALEPDDAVSHWVIDRLEPLVVSDAEHAGSNLKLVPSDQTYKAYLGVPIVTEGRGRGVLFVRSLVPRDFQAGVTSLQTLASLAALAISRRELLGRVDEHHRTMVRFALADPLTNLASQKHFDYMLKREWQRAQAEVSPLALLRLEVDNFEPHAGRIGPAQGRQTLIAIARLLDGSVYRPSDLVARLERDRFAILLPDTDRAGAEAIAGRLVKEAAELALPHPSLENQHVTLSVGVAAHEPLNALHLLEKPDDLPQLADEALEQAQTVGGNQVVSQR